MNSYEILQALKFGAVEEAKYQRRMSLEADEQAEREKQEIREREEEWKLYENNRDIFFKENPAIKFSGTISEIGKDVDIIYVCPHSVFVYLEEETYFIEYTWDNKFTWCKLGEGDYDCIAYPNREKIHDYSSCNEEKQKIFKEAVVLYIRAALCNTKQMMNYDVHKSEELMEGANREFEKIHMKIKKGAAFWGIENKDLIFLYREFCGEYYRSKSMKR